MESRQQNTVEIMGHTLITDYEQGICDYDNDEPVKNGMPEDYYNGVAYAYERAQQEDAKTS